MSDLFPEGRKVIIKSATYGNSSPFIPTGLFEPAIEAVGSGEWTIINLQISNKIGKTAGACNIFKNIIWGNDKKYFDYPMFRKWGFVDDFGNPIKRARIVGTKENIAEIGAINTEIQKWFPSGKYEVRKHSHSYPKEFITDSGWKIDMMSHEQNAKEHEGILCPLYWVDEPAKPEIIGAIMSRFSKGGILIITNTPIGAGAMLDVIEDLENQGTKVKHIYGSIYDNDSETGLSNKAGTKKGLMTAKEIKRWVAGIPPDQVQARVYGKCTLKSGKVYPMFNPSVHVREFDISSPLFKKCNLYMVLDPHPKGYPFMQWWAVTPDNKFICWNEYPTYDSLNNNYYDQLRTKETCPHAPSALSDFIKLLDSPQFGNKILRRAIDPRGAKTSGGAMAKESQGIILEYAKYGLIFEPPPFELIETQKFVLTELLKYDPQIPISVFNEPRIFFAPHCLNSIRAMERHYWLEGKEKEAETYKDPVDCIRYMLSLLGGVQYIPPVKPSAKDEYIKEMDLNDYQQGMNGIELG